MKEFFFLLKVTWGIKRPSCEWNRCGMFSIAQMKSHKISKHAHHRVNKHQEWSLLSGKFKFKNVKNFLLNWLDEKIKFELINNFRLARRKEFDEERNFFIQGKCLMFNIFGRHFNDFARDIWAVNFSSAILNRDRCEIRPRSHVAIKILRISHLHQMDWQQREIMAG